MTTEANQSAARHVIRVLKDKIHVLKTEASTLSSEVDRIEKASTDLYTEEDFVAENAALEKLVALQRNILSYTVQIIRILQGPAPKGNTEAQQPSVASTASGKDHEPQT